MLTMLTVLKQQLAHRSSDWRQQRRWAPKIDKYMINEGVNVAVSGCSMSIK